MKTLTPANLRRLEKSQGQMSLQDKLKKAGEEETLEGAKAILQKLMTKDEKKQTLVQTPDLPERQPG